MDLIRCFWGVEQIYRKHYLNKGLIDTKVGFSNGHKELENVSYKRVCQGDTEFAEVLQISYDPAQLPLKELLSFFYRIHDPTTKNQQGNDIGTQYRSAIFTHSDEDLEIAKQVTEEFQPKWGNKIVTKIEPIKSWVEAEDYHQEYLDKNPYGYHCENHFVRDL
ncbi:CYFA0S02e00166g1_1 [Cyberlindnera fabianii]|uniref:peptide-methionine (S)-S-oxide reductase n=1 Tax=Cyberlindnera fabianii TaxID=36022 RepID=A0A061ASF4_CYBFA|nr:CYFA0S02e00166g1_1 [Cyberlindnera fabianii]